MKVEELGDRPVKLWVEANTRQITVDGPTEVPDYDAERYIRTKVVEAATPPPSPRKVKNTAGKKSVARKKG